MVNDMGQGSRKTEKKRREEKSRVED